MKCPIRTSQRKEKLPPQILVHAKKGNAIKKNYPSSKRGGGKRDRERTKGNHREVSIFLLKIYF